MSAPRHKPPEPDLPRIPVRLPEAGAALPRPTPGRARPRDNDPYPVPAPGGPGPSTEESSVAEYEGARRPDPRQASPNTAGRRQPEAGLPVPQPRPTVQPTARPMVQPQPTQYPSIGRSALRDVSWSGARQLAELREADRQTAGGAAQQPGADWQTARLPQYSPGADLRTFGQDAATDRRRVVEPRQQAPGVDARFAGQPTAADRGVNGLRQQWPDVAPRTTAPQPSADWPTAVVSRQAELQ